MIDLNPSHLETIKRILAAHVPECEVRVFGSRVAWTSKDYSDLDLAVVGVRALKPDTLRRLKEAFEESALPFRVDLLDWHAISKSFRKVIEKKFEVLQKGEKKSGGVAGKWREQPLGELTENFDSIRVPVKETDRVAGPYPYYGASGVVDHVNKFLFDGEYLLIAEDGENLRTHNTPIAFMANSKFWVNNHAHIVRGNAKADTRFLMYALAATDISGYLTGSTIPKLTQGNMNRIPIVVPPLPEQHAIASILGSLDDKIELNRKMNETLEALARALFKSWFVDFDPVREKAAGRKPKGMDAATAALFPASFQDSSLGKIPKGWKARALPEVMNINPTRSLAKATLAPYLDMANMPTQGPSPAAWVMREMGSGMKFVNGDTLVARITPCLENGKTAFVDFLADGEVGWGSTEYIVLHPKGVIPPVFAYLLARTDDFRAFAIQQMTGTSGRQRVPADSLNKYCILSPEIDSPLFQCFDKLITPLFNQIKAAMMQSCTLAAMRDALLSKLLAGEMRIKDAERFVEGAV